MAGYFDDFYRTPADLGDADLEREIEVYRRRLKGYAEMSRVAQAVLDGLRAEQERRRAAIARDRSERTA